MQPTAPASLRTVLAVGLTVVSLALSWPVLAEGPGDAERVRDLPTKAEMTRLDRPFFSTMGDSHAHYDQTGSVLAKIPPSHLEYTGGPGDGPLITELLLLGEPAVASEPAGHFAVHRLTDAERQVILQVGPILHESSVHPRVQVLVDSWEDVEALARSERVYAILPPVPVIQGGTSA